MEKIYRAAKYIRTSCPDDESQYGDSVANQRRLIDAFIQTHSEIIAMSEKIDEGYSGLFAKRPAFKELLADVESGDINCIIVKDLSRWSRDYIEAGSYLRDYFPAHGIRFISIDDNIDTIYSDGFDKTIALLKSIFNEQYNRDVSIKTRSSLCAKRKQGHYVGAIPIYGYQKSLEDKHKLTPDPNTSDVVKSIFSMKLSGLSAAAIATKLNELNIPSPLAYRREHGTAFPAGGFADKSNVRWSATTILRILKDENYTGTLVQGRRRHLNYKTKVSVNLDEGEWVRIENAHPAIISRADYEAVRRTMEMDTRTAPKHDKLHIFSGMLICGCCGGNMTRKTVKQKGREYIYYYCPTGKRNGCFSPCMINCDELACIVMHKTKERIVDVENLFACISKSQFEEFTRNERTKQICVYETKINEFNKYKLHLHNSKIEGLINDIEFNEFWDLYNKEISGLEAEISALSRSYCADSLLESKLEWKHNFLQFSNVKELDRLSAVKMIVSIHIHGKEKISVNFAHQIEYEQLLCYVKSGGHTNGEKKPQIE